MPKRLRLVLEIDEVAGEASEAITDGEILETMDGAFEMLLTEQAGESIDDLEAALVRMQYEVNRRVMARQLASIAQKKLSEQRAAASGSEPIQHRIELTVNLDDMSLRPTASKTKRGVSSTTRRRRS